MSELVKLGYGYAIEGGVTFDSRDAVEAYIKRFIKDLADAPTSATVTEIDGDFNVTYVVHPADCTVCYENDLENAEDYCHDHLVTDYTLDVETTELWGVVTP